MSKILNKENFRRCPGLIGAILIAIFTLAYPSYSSNGIKNGLSLLGETLIPSLFPFMVLSGYISSSPFIDTLAHTLNRPAKKFFHKSGYAPIAFLLGCIGGYPVGAKTILQFVNDGKITKQQAQTLFFWCINPGATFVITAIGTFMLGSTKIGVILYLSCISSSLIIGIFNGCFGKKQGNSPPLATCHKENKHIFIHAVSSAVDAMLGICGWVLFFGSLSEILSKLCTNENIALFFNALAEVTLGCKCVIKAGLPLPVICAVISFGGFAVAAQISPYGEKCGLSIQSYLCHRAAGAGISALICSQLLRIFPRVAVTGTTLCEPLTFTSNIPAALLMVLMCVSLIFEVDNKRKVC